MLRTAGAASALPGGCYRCLLFATLLACGCGQDERSFVECPSISNPCLGVDSEGEPVRYPPIVVRILGTLSYTGDRSHEAFEIRKGLNMLAEQVNRMCSTPFGPLPAGAMGTQTALSAVISFSLQTNITDDFGDPRIVAQAYESFCEASQLHADRFADTPLGEFHLFLGPLGASLSQVAVDTVRDKCQNRLLMLHGPQFEDSTDGYDYAFSSGWTLTSGWSALMAILHEKGVRNFTLAADNYPDSDHEVDAVRDAAAQLDMDEVLTLNHTEGTLLTEMALMHIRAAQTVPTDAFIGIGGRSAAVGWVHNSKVFHYNPAIAFAVSDGTSWGTLSLADITAGLVSKGVSAPLGWSYKWGYTATMDSTGQVSGCSVFRDSAEFSSAYGGNVPPSQYAASAVNAVLLALISLQRAYDYKLADAEFLSNPQRLAQFCGEVATNIDVVVSELTVSTSALADRFTFYGKAHDGGDGDKVSPNHERFPSQVQLRSIEAEELENEWQQGVILEAVVRVASNPVTPPSVIIDTAEWEYFTKFIDRPSPCDDGYTTVIDFTEGSTRLVCQACWAGNVTVDGHSICTKCPEGYYAPFNASKKCDLCWEGANCTSVAGRIHPVAMEGYWTIVDYEEENVHVMKCKLDNCLGGVDNTCAGNTVGIGCEACKDGYTMVPGPLDFTASHECRNCSEARTFRYPFLFLLIIVVFVDKWLAIGVKTYTIRNPRNTYLRAVFDHIQLTTTILSGAVHFQGGFFGYVFTVFQRPLDVLFMFDCFDFDNISTRAMSVVAGFVCLPLFIVINVITTASAFMLRLGQRSRDSKDGEQLLSLVNHVILSGSFHLFVFYQTSLAMMMYAVACDEIDKPRLVNNKDLGCFRIDPVSLMAYFGIMFFGMGVPAWFYTKTNNMRAQIYENDMQTRNDWGFFYDGYQYKSFNFEVVVMTHKFLLIAVDIIPFGRLRLISRLMIIGTFFLLHIICQPCDHRDVFILTRLQNASHIALILTQIYLMPTLADDEIEMLDGSSAVSSFDGSIYFTVYVLTFCAHAWFFWLFLSHYLVTFLKSDDANIFQLNKILEERDKAQEQAANPKVQKKASFAASMQQDAEAAEQGQKEKDKHFNPSYSTFMGSTSPYEMNAMSGSIDGFIRSMALATNPFFASTRKEREEERAKIRKAQQAKEAKEGKQSVPESSTRSFGLNAVYTRFTRWAKGVNRFSYDSRNRSFNILALSTTEQVMLYHNLCETISWYLFPVPYHIELGGTERMCMTLTCREFNPGLVSKTMALIIQEKKEKLRYTVAKAALALEGVQQSGWLETFGQAELPPFVYWTLHIFMKILAKKGNEEKKVQDTGTEDKETRKRQLRLILDRATQDIYLLDPGKRRPFMVQAIRAVQLVDKDEAFIRDINKFKGKAHSTIVRYGAYPPHELAEIRDQEEIKRYFDEPLGQPTEAAMLEAMGYGHSVKTVADLQEMLEAEEDQAEDANMVDVLPTSQSLALEILKNKPSTRTEEKPSGFCPWRFLKKQVTDPTEVSMDEMSNISGADEECEAQSEGLQAKTKEVQETLAELTRRSRQLREDLRVPESHEDTAYLGLMPASGFSKRMTKAKLRTLMDHIERVQSELGEQVRFCVIGPSVVKGNVAVKLVQALSQGLNARFGRAVTLLNCGEGGTEYIFTHSWDQTPQNESDMKFLEHYGARLSETARPMVRLGSTLKRQVTMASASSLKKIGYTASIGGGSTDAQPTLAEQSQKNSNKNSSNLIAALKDYHSHYDPNHIRNLCCFGKPSNYDHGKDVYMCQDRSELRSIYLEVGDVYLVFVDRNSERRTFEECEYLHSRGAIVIPIMICQETGMTAVPEKVLICPDANLVDLWDVLWAPLRHPSEDVVLALEETIVYWLKRMDLAEGGEDDVDFNHKMMAVLQRSLEDIKKVVSRVEEHTETMEIVQANQRAKRQAELESQQAAKASEEADGSRSGLADSGAIPNIAGDVLGIPEEGNEGDQSAGMSGIIDGHLPASI